MADNPSRGEDIRNYIPAFKKGAKVPLACISAGFTTGITSAAIQSSAIANNAITREKLSAAIVNSGKIAAAFLSGTISGLLSGVIAVAHGLGVKPKFAVVSTRASHADVIAGRYVFLAAASAATSTNIYLKASKSGNVKYCAYIQL